MTTFNAHCAKPLSAFLSCVCFVALASTTACSEDTAPAIVGGSDAAADAKASGDSATPSDSGTASETGPTKDAGTPTTACVKATDCRTYSSSCGTCACIPLSKDSVDPVCTSEPVSCIVDPCRDKVVDCIGGFCALQ